MKKVVKTIVKYASQYNILIIKLQSTRWDFLCGRVLLCPLGLNL